MQVFFFFPAKMGWAEGGGGGGAMGGGGQS